MPPRLKTILSSPVVHGFLIVMWGLWIVGTGFRLPFVRADEGDGYYFMQQVVEFRTMGVQGLHDNHPPLLVLYLDLFSRLFGETKDQFHEWVFRAAMIFFAIGTGLVVYEIGWLITGSRLCAFLSGMALFYVPVFSFFSQRVSHETPTGFFIALTYLFHIKYLFEQNIARKNKLLVYSSLATMAACLFNFTGYFLVVSWAFLFLESPKSLRRQIVVVCMGSFALAALIYIATGFAGHRGGFAKIAVGSALQRMRFGANPSGMGHMSVRDWFLYVYKKRLGMINPVAWIAALFLAFFHPHGMIRRFYAVMVIIANLNVFVFSSGAVGWPCYFYFFAIPHALAPWDFILSMSRKFSWLGRALPRRLALAGMLGLFFCASQILVKQLFITAGDPGDEQRYGDELRRLNKWMITKPDMQPLYETIRDKTLGMVGIHRDDRDYRRWMHSTGYFQ